MGHKPRKKTCVDPKRSGARIVIWRGTFHNGSDEDTRIIIIDEDSNDNIPCQVITECRKEDSMGEPYWSEYEPWKGMTWLEKKLALELADRCCVLPWWATEDAAEERAMALVGEAARPERFEPEPTLAMLRDDA